MPHKETRPDPKKETPPPKPKKVRDAFRRKLPSQRSAGEVLVELRAAEAMCGP
jgi:hypothetical protein